MKGMCRSDSRCVCLNFYLFRFYFVRIATQKARRKKGKIRRKRMNEVARLNGFNLYIHDASTHRTAHAQPKKWHKALVFGGSLFHFFLVLICALFDWSIMRARYKEKISFRNFCRRMADAWAIFVHELPFLSASSPQRESKRYMPTSFYCVPQSIDVRLLKSHFSPFLFIGSIVCEQILQDD